MNKYKVYFLSGIIGLVGGYVGMNINKRIDRVNMIKGFWENNNRMIRSNLVEKLVDYKAKDMPIYMWEVREVREVYDYKSVYLRLWVDGQVFDCKVIFNIPEKCPTNFWNVGK